MGRAFWEVQTPLGRTSDPVGELSVGRTIITCLFTHPLTHSLTHYPSVHLCSVRKDAGFWPVVVPGHCTSHPWPHFLLITILGAGTVTSPFYKCGGSGSWCPFYSGPFPGAQSPGPWNQI